MDEVMRNAVVGYIFESIVKDLNHKGITDEMITTSMSQSVTEPIVFNYTTFYNDEPTTASEIEYGSTFGHLFLLLRNDTYGPITIYELTDNSLLELKRILEEKVKNYG